MKLTLIFGSFLFSLSAFAVSELAVKVTIEAVSEPKITKLEECTLRPGYVTDHTETKQIPYQLTEPSESPANETIVIYKGVWTRYDIYCGNGKTFYINTYSPTHPNGSKSNALYGHKFDYRYIQGKIDFSKLLVGSEPKACSDVAYTYESNPLATENASFCIELR